MEKLEVRISIQNTFILLLYNLRLLLMEFVYISSFSCAIENGGLKISLLTIYTHVIKHFICLIFARILDNCQFLSLVKWFLNSATVSEIFSYLQALCS